jgi:hypothetical protein
MHVDIPSNDEEEEEAFILKRVKAGAGRDYHSIVRKDVVNYQKLNPASSADFTDITRYESSKGYKQTLSLLESLDGDFLSELE